jgi:hypothetical protein
MLPFGGTNNYGGSDYNYIVDPAHPIFTGVPNPYYGSWASHDFVTDLLPEDIVLVTLGSVPGGNTVMIERYAGAGLLVAGGQTYEFGWAYGQDAGIILANMIPYYYNLELASDAQWLTENPMSGILDPDGGMQVVDVTFDASNPITVPITGTYLADIVIKTDDPVNPKIIVPAIMNVFPENFGHLEGTVMSMGLCDENPYPLAGIEVHIGDIVVLTDENGHYSKWLQEGTYEVSVAPDGHIGGTATVEIVGWQTTVQDFSLRILEPCVSAEPTSFEYYLLQNSSETQNLTLFNTGAASTPFAITELPMGPVGESRPIVTAGKPGQITIGDNLFSTNRNLSMGATAPNQLPQRGVNAITITESASQEIVSGNSVSCNNGFAHTDNDYLRVFDMLAFGITTDFNVPR